MNARFLALVLCSLFVSEFQSTASADEPSKDSGGINLDLPALAKKLETPNKDSGGINLNLPDLAKKLESPPVQEPSIQEKPVQSADRYAALAYSSSTGRYGYAYNGTTPEQAKGEALKWCRAGDARIVAWVKNGYIAVAQGYHGAIGWGWSQNPETAVDHAHANCLQRSSVSNLVALVVAKK